MITVPLLVERAVQRYRDRVALVDGERRLTFGEVGERVNRLSNALCGLDPHQGSRVAILLSNRLEFVEVDFAIACSGKVKAPLNPRLSDEERRYVLANCGASIVVSEAEELERLEALRADLPELRHIVSVDGGRGALDYATLLASASPATCSIVVDPDEPSMILHTSGTTGRPKGATTTQTARLAAATNMLLDEYLPGVDDGMVHVAPMSHGSGSKILAYFCRGARNITVSKFSPGALFGALGEPGGTSTFVVPTMVRMLLDAPERSRYDLSRLRNLTYGGAPMPPAVAEEALEAFGPVLTQVYGSCEAPHPVTVLSHRDHLAGPALRASAGFETAGVEVRIAGADGAAVPPGEPGELWVRGANVMSGYWQDAAATAEVLSEGWYRSGDIAVRDVGGAISIVGRRRDMLISGGLNVYPAEVEAVLQRHEAVSEAAVFGVDDPLWGELVAAAVVVRHGRHLDEDDLARHCAEHLANYKKPRRVVFVDELPKGVTGKVAKDELRRRHFGES